ncbi:MAG TPA: pitrilysin family protein [Gemmatimonadaceae bacterium]|nr:pitrilysin family protein [Gemmatimonadaceae bacterium]
MPSHQLRFLAAAAGGLLLVAPRAAIAQAPATSAPVRGPSVEGITEYRLGNGLRVLLFPDKSKPQTTVNVTYLVGSRQEGFGETGMAHLLEHMQFKGTPRHRAPSDEITAHGAQFNASTSFDRTNFFETFPAADSNLVWALDLEADRMVNSFIARADLEKEFPVVRSEFESGENNDFLVTLKRVLGSAYLFHAYGHLPIGARSDIENAPIERLQAFYKKYYEPDNAILMIAGNFDEPRALALVQEKFGAIPRPARVLQPTYTVEPPQDGEREVTVRRAGDEQLVMAFYHVPSGRHPDFPAIDVLTRVLGDPASGRLFQALVATRKAAAVQADNLQQYDPAGLFLAARVPKDQSIDSAQAAMNRVAEELATTKPPTAAEVERAKQGILKGFELAPTNTSTFGLQLSEWMAMGDWRLFFYHRDRVKAVTPADVQRVARTYLKTSNRTIGRFIPTDAPDRVEIAAAPSADSLLAHYHSSEVVAAGEAFDPSPANIESRVKRSTLASGMHVALLAKKNRGEAVSAVINLHLGTEQSLTGRATVATLTAQMLMRGTRALSRQQLRDSLDALKAAVAVLPVSANNVRVTIATTRPNLPAVLQLAGDMLRSPALSGTEFEQVQREAIANVDAQRGDPVFRGQQLFARLLMPYPKEHPRYVPTSDEQSAMLRAATVAQVQQFHKDFYGASSAELVVVGDFDEAAVTAVARKAFDHWKSAKPYRPMPVRLAGTAPSRQSVETPDKANAFFVAGQMFPLRDTDPDYAPMLFANYLLGESPLDSRLPSRIRVKESLSYVVQSGLNVSSYDRVAQWLAVAIYNPQNAEKVSAAFFDEMGKIVKDGFTPDEIEKSKAPFLQRRTLARANDAQLAVQLANELALGRTMHFDEALEKQIAALTADQVNAALRRSLDPAKMTVVLAGDFAKVTQAGEKKP